MLSPPPLPPVLFSLMKFKQTAVRGPAGSGRPPVLNQLLLKPLPVRILCEPGLVQSAAYFPCINNPIVKLTGIDTAFLYGDFPSFSLYSILHYLSRVINSHLLSSICIIYLIYNLNFRIVIPSSKCTKLNSYKKRTK